MFMFPKMMQKYLCSSKEEQSGRIVVSDLKGRDGIYEDCTFYMTYFCITSNVFMCKNI